MKALGWNGVPAVAGMVDTGSRRTGLRVKRQKWLACLLAFLLVLTPLGSAQGLTYRELDEPRPGNPVLSQRRQLASGVSQESWRTVNRAGRPVVYQTITMQPADPLVQPLVWSGTAMTDRRTVSEMSRQADAQGYEVVAAVNGDFYNVATGAPIGIVVQRGELLSSDGGYVFAIGFFADGRTQIGKPALQYLLSRNGMPAGSFLLNKQQGASGIYAYNIAYGYAAGSSQPGVDVVVQAASSKFFIGSRVEGTVLEVRTDTQGTPIGENQVVLSARAGTPEYEALRAYVPGDAVALEVRDPAAAWTGVTEALGGLYRLLENGRPLPELSTTNVNPVTLAGRKADGSIVLLQTDGRQSAWSNGISHAEGAALMLQMDCTDALVLDGGGSSTAVARMPGEVSPTLLNRPSDGTERKISNALLVASRALPQMTPDPQTGMQPAAAAAMLHLYPDRQYLLPGAEVSYRVLATDTAYHASAVPGGLNLSSTGGVFGADGRMTVTGGVGLHVVSAMAGAAIGEATFIVPDHLTEIRLSATSVVLAAGESVDLQAVGYLESVEVAGVDASFVWQLDAHVGTVTPQGVVTVTGEPGATGQLVVSWGGTQTQIPVAVAREPLPVEEFEAPPVWAAAAIKAQGSAARAFVDPELALFGDGLLRVWYDFRPTSEDGTGTAGVAAGPAGPAGADGTPTFSPLPLEGVPTAVGMWVYGNNSRYWLRGRLMDATGREVDLDYTPEYKAAAGTGGIDWTGWRYVEAAIPQGLVAPYRLTVPIRLMCPQEELKDTGTILVDRIRSLYGVRNDDMTPPRIEAVWPPDDGVVVNNVLTLSSRSYEEAGGSGFLPERTRLTVDGIPFAAPEITWDPDGAMRVSAALGSPVPLAAGDHVATLHVEDRFGNKTTRTWAFQVAAASSRLSLSLPEAVSAGEVFEVAVNLAIPNPLKALEATFRWDPALLEPVDMNPAVPGIQTGTEKYVTDAEITANAADAAAGTWTFSVAKLDSTIKAAERRMMTMKFRARTSAAGTTAIKAVGARITVAGVGAPQSISLLGGPVRIAPAFHLDVRNLVEGETALLTVTDRNGTLVPDVTIFLGGTGIIATTDGYGTASFTLPPTMKAGTAVSLQAARNGLTSLPWTGVVGAAAQGAAPRAVSVSPISEPGGMAVHWLSTAATGTQVQLVEQRRYAGFMPVDALKAVAATTKTTLADPGTGTPLYEHKAVFRDLKSATTYRYRITDGANGVGKTGVMTTPVSKAGETFRFGFLTDPQAVDAAGYIPFRGALRRLLGQAPDMSFLIIGGDIVDNGAKTSQWWGFYETAASWLDSLPWLAVPGNHEYKEDAALAGYKAFVGMPATGPSGMGERSYTVQNGDARFYMLDTQDDLDAQLAWLRAERNASDAVWHIVVMHRGIYGGFYDESGYRAKAAPVFDELGIDLVLSGHDHTWQRTTMKDGQQVKPGEGTTYITGGSAGAKFYDAPARAWSQVSYDGDTPAMTLITVSPTELAVTASHVEKNVTVRHDAFVIRKP